MEPVCLAGSGCKMFTKVRQQTTKDASGRLRVLNAVARQFWAGLLKMPVFLECDNCMQSQVCKEVLSNNIFFTPVNYIHRQLNNVRMN